MFLTFNKDEDQPRLLQPHLVPQLKIHPSGAVLDVNQLGFVNLTYKWSHRSNV